MQTEKEAEISALNDEINQCKRDLDNQRREIDKLKKKPNELYRSTDSLVSVSMKTDDNSVRNWVQIPQEGGRKKAWKKQLAVLDGRKFALYNSEKDQQATNAIELK